MNFDESRFLLRCFDLARLGAGTVSPNPMVGAVLVCDGRIIGEGYHRRHGGPHAEVEALRSVREEDKPLVPLSTLYVSLEPCCIYGRTPPCTNLILESGIRRVVVSNPDLTPGVNGKGLEQLRLGGVEVKEGLLEDLGNPYCAIRNTYVTQGRPYVVLKFARSADGFLGQAGRQIWLTGEASKRLVHKWRSETDAILVGAQTLRVDDPVLNNRLFSGKSPVRLVMDPRGDLPHNLRVFGQGAPTWVFTGNPKHYKGFIGAQEIVDAPFDGAFIPFLLDFLAVRSLSSLMVEGGALLLQQFLEGNWWDEARVFTSPQNLLEGIKAPDMAVQPSTAWQVQSDLLQVYHAPRRDR